MKIELKWLKDIPTQKINMFEDRVVYNVAILTRERVKNTDAYPYLSGELARQEIKQPIMGSNKQYAWLSGTDYAMYVWNMKNVNWTNKKTKPQWYYTQYKQEEKKILSQAENIAIKEI